MGYFGRVLFSDVYFKETFCKNKFLGPSFLYKYISQLNKMLASLHSHDSMMFIQNTGLKAANTAVLATLKQPKDHYSITIFANTWLK